MAATSVAITTKRRKLDDTKELPFLPENVIYNILVFVPASVLHKVMKYVCQDWYKIISSPAFIRENIDRCIPSLLIQHYAGFTEDIVTQPLFLSGGLKLCGVNWHSSTRELCDSYDGVFVFASIEHPRGRIYVANPLTKTCITRCLPPLCETLMDLKLGRTISGQYKVVCFYKMERRTPGIAIVSLGPKSTGWRTIGLKQEYLTKGAFFRQIARTEGVLVYVRRTNSYPERPVLVAVDLESELIYEIPLPHRDGLKTWRYFPRGGFLTVVDYHGEKREFYVWNLSKVSNPVDQSKWTLHCKCKLKVPTSLFKLDFAPFSWITDGEELVFSNPERYNRCCINYNVKTGKTSTFRVPDSSKPFILHTESLVSLSV